MKVSNEHKVTLHFAHANGFPSASYRKLFSALPEDYTLLAIEKFGHSERFPINNNWHNPADEMLEYLDQHTDKNQKIVAVGHSFGAVVSFIAACRQPEKFSQLIMLDPPLATGLSRHLFRFAKKTSLIDKLTPAKLAQFRKRTWNKDTNLIDYFAQRGLFKSMDRDCIADYIAAVMREQDNRLVLDFDPDIEARVFRTLPDNLHRYAGHLQCPATIITGEQTDVCVPFLRKKFIKENKLQHLTMPGGHMFPLEKPRDVAQAIVELINSEGGTSSKK